MREMGWECSTKPSQAWVPSLTCPIGEEPDCKDITARLQYVKVGSCKSEEEVDIHYCQVRAPDFNEASMERGFSLFGRYLLSYISEGSGKFTGRRTEKHCKHLKNIFVFVLISDRKRERKRNRNTNDKR